MSKNLFPTVLLCFLFVMVINLSSFSLQAKPAESSNDTPKKRPQVSVTVDPRVELMSVIFHLAGNEEYDMCQCKNFIKKVDKYFKPYKEHEAVQMAQKLRKTRGMGFNAPMGLAIHIKDINSMEPIVPLNPRPQTLDIRWRAGETEKFLKVCNEFVRDTKFETFLANHKSVYDRTVNKLEKLVKSKAALEWFDKFFGKNPNVDFNLVISIINGKSSYGPKIQVGEKLQIYSILGVMRCGFLGFGEPYFPEGSILTIVHEFGHSYSNPVVERHMHELQRAGEKLFPPLEKKMKKQAYSTWQTMMYESVVRASEVRYQYANGDESKAKRIAGYNIRRGFIWTKELSELLGEYEAQRDIYPDLDAFFPRIVEFFNSYADKQK